MLQTPHVFLDTEVFVGKNFHYDHKDFKALLGYAQAGTITLRLTEVHYREIQKKIRDRVADAKRALEPIRGTKVHPNVVILRNAKHLGFGGIFDFDGDSVVDELIVQFEKFLKDGNVQISPVAGLLVGPVLDKYFRSEPPFEKREEKKNEFPDAIGVAVAAEWCQANASKAYLVSGDKGVRKACSGDLIPLSSIPELTDLIALALPQQAAIARGWFHYAAAYIRERIAREFEGAGFILTDQEGEVLDTHVSEDAVKLTEPEFLSVDEGYAELVVHAEVPFTADVTYDDPSATFWVEGEKYVVDSIEQEVEQTETVDVYVGLSFNPAVAAPEFGQSGPAADVVENVSLDITDIGVSVEDWEDYK